MFQSLGSPNPFHLNDGTQKKSNLYRQWGLGRGCSFANGSNIMNNLLRREVHGTFLHRLKNPFGDNGTPGRLKMPAEDIIPASALEAGNIFMGFTNCGRYLLSYTCRPSENFGASVFDADASYMYTLHIWLFTPYSKLRKVSQVTLFDNNGVYDNNLLIDISQWDLDDSHILITGHSVNPDSECNHTFYTTVTTIPDAKNCGNCIYMHDEELEDDIASNSRLRTNCILHGLTLHIKYDHVPPYPKFNSDIQLRFKDTVLLNTGNVIHAVTFKLIRPSLTVKSDTVLVPAASSTVSTSRVPLHCDIWLKISNANLGALTSVKSIPQKKSSDDRDENIVSLNGLDFLISLFPSSSNPVKCNNNTDQYEAQPITSRRYSQSSTDSDLFSPKSFGSPMSPPFLNKPRQNQPEAVVSSSDQSATSNLSPSKLMLPPQERKFFKRRLSSQSLTTTNSKAGQSQSCSVVAESCSSSSSSSSSNDGKNGGGLSSAATTPPTCSKNQENQSAFDVFEMRFEDTAVDRHLSSFKTFRKRRLADKKYEFNDADLAAENIMPLKLTRRRSKLQGSMNSNPRSPRNENENTSTGNESPRGTYSELSHPRSPRTHHVMSPGMSPNYNDSAVSDVLRPLNSNLKVKVPTLSPNSNANGGVDGGDLLKFKEDDITKEFKDYSSQNNKKADSDIPFHPHEKPTVSIPVNCIAKVMRSFIQREDDNMSVITDIEDELYQGYPFPVALPLEVHGAGYQQLQMISNSKADKFQAPVVQVLQRTLDIEMLCNEVANLICLASDKSYCSCLDFDLAFADANPDRGTVTSVVVMLLQATNNVKTKTRSGDRSFCNPDPRKKYEAMFVCEWSPCNERCRILYKSSLRELETVADPWHPTKAMEYVIKSRLKVFSTRKTLSNALAVHDWQSLDELSDAYGIVTLIKDEGSTKTERRLNDCNSFENNVIDPASSLSTLLTDSDDEEWGM